MLRATWPEISDPTRASGYTNPVAPTASSRPSSASASRYLQSEGQPLFRPDIRGPCNTDLPRLGDLCLFPGPPPSPHLTLGPPSLTIPSRPSSTPPPPGSCQAPHLSAAPRHIPPRQPSAQAGKHQGTHGGGWPPSSGLTPGITNGAVGSSEPWPGASSHQVQVRKVLQEPSVHPISRPPRARETPGPGWPHKAQPSNRSQGQHLARVGSHQRPHWK